MKKIRSRSDPATSLYDREIGRRVRMRRLELDMSQSSLGKALGVTFQQVQKYEKGSNRVSSGRLQRVAEILNVPVTFFYSDLGGSGTSEVHTLMDNAYSLRLLKAMARIEDRQVERRIVELLEAVVDVVGRRER
jgi:transcriptional regulator with XRE-family HTH domain